MKLKMNIGYNKTTRELIGYSNPDINGNAILVTAYAVDDLEKEFARVCGENVVERETMIYTDNIVDTLKPVIKDKKKNKATQFKKGFKC